MKQPEETKRVILEAAGDSFSRLGYAGSGLGAIVSKAGMTKGALFHHFPDKRALLVAWVETHLGAQLNQLWVEPLAAVTDLAGLQALCRRRCDEMEVGDAVSALVSLSAELAGGDDGFGSAFEMAYASWRGALAEMLARGQEDGWIHPSIMPEVEATFLVSAFSGFTVTTRFGSGTETRAACVRALDAYLETLRSE